MIRAAGILFLTKDSRQVLLLQRSGESDHSGEWCIPGGRIEDGETAEEAAVRESMEEAGASSTGARTLLSRTVLPAGPSAVEAGDLTTVAVPAESVDFTTFLQIVDEPFNVTLSDESTGYAWAPIESPPEPLHPGCRISLARLTADELGVARMMADGSLTSPQRYENVMLFDLRITGTGAAWREAHQEFTFRNQDNYLNSDFLARCNGLPVLWEHPKNAVLDSKEWSDRVIGTVFLPYIKGDEVWGIAKIYDDAAASLMEAGGLSTSPTVNFLDPTVNAKMILEDGRILLIEGKPSLVDHVAVCEIGVWDKGGEPSGVATARTDSDMTEEEKKAAADAAARKGDEDKAKADAAKADADFRSRMDAFMGAVTKGFADMNSRMDSLEKGKAKADGAEEAAVANEAANEPGAGDDKEVARKEGDPVVVGRSDGSKRKDAARKDETDEEKEAREKREREEKAKDDSSKAKADSAAIEAAVKKHLSIHLPKQLTDEDFAAMSTAQAKADAVFSAFSQRAPRPLDGESNLGYRRRLATMLKAHSAQWKDVDLQPFADEKAFGVVEGQIYADAQHTARNPIDIPPGELRAIHATDETGRRITSFVGQPRDWMRGFAPEKMRVVGIYNGTR